MTSPPLAWAIGLIVGVSAAVHAQSPATPLTLADAVEAARRDAPAALEAAARARAAAATVSEAQAANQPRLDGLWQLNRASRNNVFGLLLPQNVVPAISGPVLGTDSFGSAWGSAAGLLFSIEVYDFGRRGRAIDAARAQAAAGEAAAEAVRLRAGVAAADAYLQSLGAEQAAVAARANRSRLENLERTIRALVDAELRPGADQSRVEAELAAARNQVIGREQALALARLQLAAAIGRPDASPTLDPGRLLVQLPVAPPDVPTVPSPTVRAAEASVAAAEAKLEAIGRLFRPKIVFSAALAARASGANVDGTIDGSAGLWPNVPNWAAGVTVTFPFFDKTSNGARARVEAANADGERARLAGISQQARTETLQARVLVEAAARMIANVPAQVAAARQSEAQARARYEAGLTGITEVADAQRMLADAEVEEALSVLALWRARLAHAAAAGDLAAFLAEASAPRGPRIRP